ncbi:MAG: radical SAM protein [Chitinispirillaceae bacterium]|nr:radical SAM protein [Chitinispirillaceae bacterium]
MNPHGSSGTADAPPLRLVAWEVTRSCMLACRHCRAAAHAEAYGGELTTEECRRVIDSLAAMGGCIVILTGGEPMLRKDIYDIARYGSDRGLRMVMAPCGMLLDTAACNRLKEAGIARISLSIDGATAGSHDAFRGVPGAFDGVMRGSTAARETNLPFQINTTVTRTNLAELPAIFKLAVDLGAVSFHPFLLVPTGRGSELADEVIPAVDYEKTLRWIHEQAKTAPITVKPTCAPHYYRIAKQEVTAGSAPATRHHAGHEHSGLEGATKGCLGGQGFAFISHIGKVQICGFLPLEAGDLRQSGFDFNRIWRTSQLFREVRDVDHYHGKCGWCDYRGVCGGCRARAFAVDGDHLGEEPCCLYRPGERNK